MSVRQAATRRRVRRGRAGAAGRLPGAGPAPVWAGPERRGGGAGGGALRPTPRRRSPPAAAGTVVEGTRGGDELLGNPQHSKSRSLAGRPAAPSRRENPPKPQASREGAAVAPPCPLWRLSARSPRPRPPQAPPPGPRGVGPPANGKRSASRLAATLGRKRARLRRLPNRPFLCGDPAGEPGRSPGDFWLCPRRGGGWVGGPGPGGLLLTVLRLC
ncbi:uncharacterized protein [Equus przewalskii]|uniref:Uncharacterized protein n=1 Tax=Equus przewalskii TaxID=9798 RepID=A0ABM4PF51_EQUPR